MAKKRLPNNLEAEEAVLATARAGQQLQALGLLNTCLIRSLVAGALLSDRDNLSLHLGIQKGEGSQGQFDGHSWLTLGSQILPHPDEALAPNGEPYAIMASFPMRRPS